MFSRSDEPVFQDIAFYPVERHSRSGKPAPNFLPQLWLVKLEIQN